MKFKKQVPYEILITPTVNDGFLVKCGCVVAVYANHNDLIRDLREYLENPVEVQKQYNHDIAALSTVHVGTGPMLWGTRANMAMEAAQEPVRDKCMNPPGGQYNENL